ncbi:hypothetical protein DFH06DRAFT_223381 [Mycena polygramma]|nr:hypothetical protein DFH06DRAFT_223381 [Mycena polygramma]
MENENSQFFLPATNLLSVSNVSAHCSLVPKLDLLLQQHGRENSQNIPPTLDPDLQDSTQTSIKPKQIARSSQSPPSTSCRTPLVLHPNVTALHPSSISLTECHPRDRVGDASISEDTNNHPLSNKAERNQEKVKAGEGPDDLPPIAFLREQSQSVSPSFSTREVPALISHAANQASTSSISAAPSTAFPFKPHTERSIPPPSSTSTHSAPVRSRSVSRHHEPTARTRAETGVSAREPAPRYTYTYNSLMRRRDTPERQPYSTLHERSAPAAQRDLEAACRMKVARVGKLRGPLEITNLGTVAEHFKALRSALMHDAMDVDAAGQASGWVRLPTNTAPTASYLALLEDTFGTGSGQRGEGAKPVDPGRRRAGKSKGRSGSASSSGMDVDTEETASMDLSADGEVRSRVHDWITEIQMVVKGKRQLGREDLRLLANTLHDIADMSVAEGQALGDDGPRLRKSIWQLAQVEDIPFRDEYKVRGWARRLLKHWPA